MQICPAVAADIPAMVKLLWQLFSQEVEFCPDEEVQARGLSKIVTNPDCGVILLAVDGQHVAGMVSLLYTVSTALGERVALLEDMVVAQQERGKGIGSRLLNEAVIYAKAAGCKRITLLTDVSNLAAQRFYQGHGFEISTMLPMRILL